MKNRFQFLTRGAVNVRAAGFDEERFLNIAAQRGISIFGVREEKGEAGEEGQRSLAFWTAPGDFFRLKPVAKKAGVRLRIVKKAGLPFFLYRNRKRKLMAAGLLSFFLLLYGLSFFIWDISFLGNRRFTDEMLLHYMEGLPVTHGMRKAAVSCEELEAALRNEFPEITWVSARISGTRLIIKIKENEALAALEKKEGTPCDLAAKREGTVVKTVVRSGICQVKPGDTVEEGEILVRGSIPITDDGETLVAVHEVAADAEIYGKTAYTYEKNFPVSREVKSRTGRRRRGIFLEFGENPFYLLLPAPKDTQWEFAVSQRRAKLFENFYLPFSYGVITAWEYVPYEKVYTKEEKKALADGIKNVYMENLSEKGLQILGIDDKIEETGSGFRIRGTMTVVENLAKPVPIPENQEENQPVNEHH